VQTALGETPSEAQAKIARRALSDERRVRILEELRAEPDGLGAEELARRLGLHQNTVRWHCGILGEAGLICSRRGERLAAGRPRIVYTLGPEARAGDRDEYRLLATIVTGALSDLADGSARADEAGQAWGRYLVRRPSPLTRVSDEEAMEEVVALLDQQGFAPRAAARQVSMRRCPFHDLAENNPEIVCSVHRGLVSGALAELGSDLEVDGLDVLVEPDLCILRLAPTPRTTRRMSRRLTPPSSWPRPARTGS
jgi:predicted ArsR family transcriptional regulator